MHTTQSAPPRRQPILDVDVLLRLPPRLRLRLRPRALLLEVIVEVVVAGALVALAEQLGESEQWYCSKCKKHSQAYKKLDIWTTPDVLILHLKRFQYAQNTYFVHRQKLDDLVSFPLRDLDLSSQVLGAKDDPRGCLYDLYAVSEHSGGLGGGHYTATAIDDATQVW